MQPWKKEQYMSEVHIDRLKTAYVREPEPTPYFSYKIVTAETVRPEKVTEALPSNAHTEVSNSRMMGSCQP